MKSTKEQMRRVGFVFLDDFIIRGELKRTVESIWKLQKRF